MLESENLVRTKVLEALGCLKQVASERPFPVSIMVETSVDEAIMVGTVESYIWLITQLLRHLSEKDHPNYRQVELGNYSVRMLPLSVFNSLADLVPRSLCVTNSDDESQAVVEYLRQLNPE